MVHVVTDSLLEDHLQCHSKSYLRFQGRLGEATAYSNLSVQLDAHHRVKAFQWLATKWRTAGVRCFNGFCLDTLATGDAMILNAVGRADGLETHFHGLQRVPGDSRLGAYYYQPMRICRQVQPSSVVRLLLAFDALILDHLQGFSPEHGVLICGPTFKRIRVHLRAHLKTLATVLTRLRLQIVSGSEPPLALNPHCDVCGFKQFCRSKAEEADNLTLLRGMTIKEVARNNSKGIFTINQLSYTFRSRRPAKRQRQRFPHSFALQARALRENRVHVHGNPCLTFSPTQVYLDIEGLPDRGFYYLIGALVVHGQSQKYHYFWADDESHEVNIFVELAELLAATADGPVFHYGNYDVNAVRRMLSRMPGSCQKPLRAMLANTTNVLPIVSSHVYFPTTSNSLKDVASFLGFRWSNVEASGLQSIVWREQWEDGRDEVLKARLIEYNRDDCLALRVLAEFIASIKDREAREESERLRSDKVVFTSELMSTNFGKHRFGKAQFCLPDLEFVNKCAYYDYQRDRIYFRTRKTRSGGKSSPTPRRPRAVKVNKYIEVRCKRCPHCNSRRFSQGRALSTRTIDMKFLVSGVKKWVTVYSARQCHCDRCGSTFRPPAYPEAASLYGDGLVTWVIYQNVVLGLNMLKVERSLGEVFKLNIPQPTLHRFKASVARRY